MQRTYQTFEILNMQTNLDWKRGSGGGTRPTLTCVNLMLAREKKSQTTLEIWMSLKPQNHKPNKDIDPVKENINDDNKRWGRENAYHKLKVSRDKLILNG